MVCSGRKKESLHATSAEVSANASVTIHQIERRVDGNHPLSGTDTVKFLPPPFAQRSRRPAGSTGLLALQRNLTGYSRENMAEQIGGQGKEATGFSPEIIPLPDRPDGAP
jgi:hypothetical protein